MDEFLRQFNQFMDHTGLTILKCVSILILGILFIKVFIKSMKKTLVKNPSLDNTIGKFALSILNIGLYLALFFIVCSIAGISTSSFVTLIGAVGLALSLALQDSLSNLANGLIIVTTKPFKVGDHVLINGCEGNVHSIHFFSTNIVTFDNQIITIPNKSVVSANIINYSTRLTRRIDLVVPVSYESDIKEVKKIILNTIKANSHVAKLPAPSCNLDEYGDSSLNFKVRCWTASNKYAAVRFELLETILPALVANKVEIPYNKQDIYVKEMPSVNHSNLEEKE